MLTGAQSPEELDTLLEDAFVLRDAAALARLFEVAGVLVAEGLPAAHGRAEIGRVGARLWRDGRSYVADARRVLMAHGVALVIGHGAVHVVRRGRDRSWRYVITMLHDGASTDQQDPPHQRSQRRA